MDFFIRAAMGVLAVLFIIAVLINSVAASRHLMRGAQFRQAFARRIAGLRLHKMLNNLGIDLSRYLDRVPAKAIEEQIERCETCSTQAVCDEEFARSGGFVDAASFCPNHDALRRLKR